MSTDDDLRDQRNRLFNDALSGDRDKFGEDFNAVVTGVRAATYEQATIDFSVAFPDIPLSVIRRKLDRLPNADD